MRKPQSSFLSRKTLMTIAQMIWPMMKAMFVKLERYERSTKGRTSDEYEGATVAKMPHGNPHRNCPKARTWILGAKNVMNIRHESVHSAPMRTRFWPKCST